MVSTLIFVPVAYMGLDQVRAWLRGIGPHRRGAGDRERGRDCGRSVRGVR